MFSTRSISAPFAFIDPGTLIDGELQLVAPDHALIDAYLAASRHPLTLADDPSAANVTRESLHDFLREAPAGRCEPRADYGHVPAYRFWIRCHNNGPHSVAALHNISIAGGISLRIGQTHELQMYSGNIGYGVMPPARGRHFALRAVRLLLPLARAHGLSKLWITANPENLPSRRTCEGLGARYLETVDVPPEHPFRQRGESKKCRYLLEI